MKSGYWWGAGEAREIAKHEAHFRVRTSRVMTADHVINARGARGMNQKWKDRKCKFVDKR